jgi:hypothetical protein
MSQKSELANYTLRLPEEYRRRLELEAEARGRSLNQQIIRVIEMYFANAGYPSELLASAGQLFIIRATLAHSTAQETVWEFLAENSRTGNEEARYLIGVDMAFIRDLKASDESQTAKEVGLALLNFHAKQGRDIRTLSWLQNPPFDLKRIVHFSEVPSDVQNVPDFLELLAKGQWNDGLLVPDEELDAIKTLLIAARLEQSEIIKHMGGADGMWVQIGSKQFDQNKDLYVHALTKMGLLRLVALQPKKSPTYNTYLLTPEAVQYLAKIASWSAA